jgi:hypothetical protein
MLVFSADVFIEYYILDFELARNNTFVIIMLQGLLVLLYVGQCFVALLF